MNEGDKAPKNRSAACPFNMFRSSNDIRAKWSSIMNNLHTTQRFLNVSRPGCWAYPDMVRLLSCLRICFCFALVLLLSCCGAITQHYTVHTALTILLPLPPLSSLFLQVASRKA